MATNLRRDKTVVKAFLIVPTLRRGNAASDALRHALLERCRMHYHAERGNDVKKKKIGASHFINTYSLYCYNNVN
jgi:hypothetical protein